MPTAFDLDICEPQFGWIPDEKGLVAATERQVWHEALGQQISELAADDDDGDRFPWRTFASLQPQLFERDSRTDGLRLKARNQGNAGTCVGAATAQLMTILQLLDITVRKEPERWVGEVSIEWAYAAGRQIANQLGSWDGSTNSWQLSALEKWGVLFQKAYGSIDLTNYSPSRAQQWARSGVPAALKPEAVKHKLLKAYRIRSVDDWWTLLGAGYTVNLCSNWGGTSRRDSDGVMARSGTWAHSMASFFRRKHARRGRLFGVQNSWGSQHAEGGGAATVQPFDMPWGSFYITESEAAWIVKTGEVIAYCDFEGFRKPAAPWGTGHSW